MSNNATIGALNVELATNTAEYKDGLKQAQSALASFGKLATQAATAIGAAMAATASVAALAVRAAINNADATGVMAQQAGVAVKAYSELQHAADITGVAQNQLGVGLKRLGLNMAGAAADTKGKTAAAFRQLGVEVVDASGQLRSVDAVFADVAQGFAGAADGAGKSAVAVQLFGETGADLLPLLNQGKDGLGALAQEAAALGLVIDEKTATAAAGFNDNLTRLQSVGRGVATQLAAQMLPALTDVTSGLADAAKNSGLMTGVGHVLAFSLRTVASAGLVAAHVFAALANAVKTTVGAISAVLQGQFDVALERVAQGLVDHRRSLNGVAQSIATIWTGAGDQAEADAPQIAKQLEAPLAQGASRARAARADLESEYDKAARAVREYLDAELTALAQQGLSQNEIKARRALIEAQKAYLLGLAEESRRLWEVAERYRDLDVKAQDATDAQVNFLRTPQSLRPQFDSAWDNFRDRIEEVEHRFRSTRYEVEDLFYGIRNNDWVAAFGGLVRAIDNIKMAFSQAADQATRMSAAAGAVSAVGSAVGGKVGGVISGAASGAAAGTAIMPGIGTAIGAIIGGLGGLLGGNKAKKRAKEQARQEAERRAAELAAAKRALEIRLLELGGDAAAALAASRADELKAMDASLHALQQEVWAKEDAARAAAEAEALVAQTRALHIEKLEALGQSEEALAMIREDELAALPEALRDLKRSIYAVIDATAAAEVAEKRLADVERAQADRVADAEGRVADARRDVAAAIDAEIGALTKARDRFADLAEELNRFRGELRGGAVGGAGLGQQLAEAQRAFDAVKGRTDADSLARLPELGRALIAAQAAVAPNQRALDATVQEVARATAAGEAAARDQISAADAQIAALESTAEALGALRETTLGLQASQDALAEAIIHQSGVMKDAAAAIADAMAGLAAAQAAVAAAANSNDGPLVPAYDNAATLAGLSAAAAGLSSASPTSAGDAPGLGELADLLRAQDAKLAAIAHSSSDQASQLRRWDGDGMPEIRDVG